MFTACTALRISTQNANEYGKMCVSEKIKLSHKQQQQQKWMIFFCLLRRLSALGPVIGQGNGNDGNRWGKRCDLAGLTLNWTRNNLLLLVLFVFGLTVSYQCMMLYIVHRFGSAFFSLLLSLLLLLPNNRHSVIFGNNIIRSIGAYVNNTHIHTTKLTRSRKKNTWPY